MIYGWTPLCPPKYGTQAHQTLAGMLQCPPSPGFPLESLMDLSPTAFFGRFLRETTESCWGRDGAAPSTLPQLYAPAADREAPGQPRTFGGQERKEQDKANVLLELLTPPVVGEEALAVLRVGSSMSGPGRAEQRGDTWSKPRSLQSPVILFLAEMFLPKSPSSDPISLWISFQMLGH